MKHIAYILALIFLTISTAAFAQQKKGIARLDSLIAEVSNMNEDLVGVRLLGAISFGYVAISPDESWKWATRELSLAQKIGWRKGEAFAYCNMGTIYTNRGAYKEAVEVFNKAKSLLYKSGAEKEEAEILDAIGTICWYKKEYSTALKHYFNAITTAKKYNDEEWKQNVLVNIGSVYAAQGMLAEGLKYQQQALKLAEARDDSGGIMLITGNIVATYADLKKFSLAIGYGFKVLGIAGQLGNKLGAALAMGNIGANYFNLARYNVILKSDSIVSAERTVNLDRGIEYLNKGIEACRELRYARGVEMFTAALNAATALNKSIKRR